MNRRSMTKENPYRRDRYNSLDEFRKAHEYEGLYFFSKKAMSFFNSRICGDLIGGRYFVTSEKAPHNIKRYYSVREINPETLSIRAAEDCFQRFSSARQAKRYAEELANKDCRRGKRPHDAD